MTEQWITDLADTIRSNWIEWERDSAVIVCRKTCGLGALLLPASGVGPDIMKRHQFGVAAEPSGEVIGNESHHDGLAVEYGG